MADETKARMTGPEHFREAEVMLDDFAYDDKYAALVVAEAQVHATLALVAVTAELASQAPAPVGRTVYGGFGEPHVDGPWKALLNPSEEDR